MSINCRRVLLAIAVAFSAGWSGLSAFAQEPKRPMRVVPADEPTQPTALVERVQPLADVARFELPPLDLGALRAEDDRAAAEGAPPRYALPHPVFIKPSNDGSWEALPDGRMLWRLRVSSFGAISINLGFTRYVMPEGGRLYLYSADGSYVLRPFTYRDNADHHELWTPPVAGDEIVVELTIPPAAIPALELELGSINIGYRSFGDILTPEDAMIRSGSCNVDVVCPVADPWDLEIPSVAVISTGGSTFCTGFMVNNVNQDLTPYFMTAAHCGVNAGNAASLVTFWNYQNSFCRGEPGGGGTGNGSLSQFNTGSTFRASFSGSDFTIVQLSSMPNPAWNISWAGWDNTGANPPRGACIHHPSTDEKRITFYDIDARPTRPTHGSSWPCSAFPGPGDNSHITAYWSLGVTEPGSSGSPLFDDNHRVIGQLHGGPSSCSQSGDGLSDCYGRISRSWTGGGTSSSRLRDWLDPGNTGATAVDTVSGGGLNVTPTSNVLSVGLVGGPFSNPSTTYTISNQTNNAANYTVTILGGGTAPLLLNGGPGPLSGTVNPSSSVNVTVTYAASANSLPAGVYFTTVRFVDTTNSIQTDRTHTLEIGQTGFDTTPAGGLVSGGPVGGPFNATLVYTVTSTRPTPVTVRVATAQPWISINGVAGPVDINLNGTGANANVTIGFSAAANSLSPGLYNGTVTFTNLNGGAGNTSRPVQLDVGRFTYPSTDTPIPLPDLSTRTSTITVNDAYCIGDVNVEINITHTYIGDLIVELRSPHGTVVRLHNRTGGSADDIMRTYDDGVLNPDGPGLLADFNGQIVTGNWVLTISDNAAQDIGTLNYWTLKIASAGQTCPPVANNKSLEIPDSAMVPITLTGSSGVTPTPNYVITSLPANGILRDPAGGVISTVPYTLTNLGQVVNYQPQSYYVGTDNFNFKLNDGQDSNVATVSLSVGLVLYDFPLNSNPGWTADPDWAFGIPAGACGDPSSGRTGSNVYGYNLNGCYPNNLSPVRYLKTPALNLTGAQNVTLNFWRWLGIESSAYDHASIDVSTNGTTWTNVWNHTGGTFSETAWTSQSYSLPSAANQPTVYLRWGMGTTDGSVVYQGWNIDDIQIRGLRPPRLGDIDNDGDCDDVDTDLFVQVLLGLDTNPLHKGRADLNQNYLADGNDVKGFTTARLAP